LDDKCPVPKGVRFEDLSQGSICIRCPILCCALFGNPPERMVEPKGYREDWALLWKDLFDGNAKYEDFDLPIFEQTKERE
jgi:hypothetical protein